MLSDHVITIQRLKRRTLSVQIEKDGSVLVKAPERITKREIDAFLTQHQTWIDKRVLLVKKNLEKRRGEGEYLYMGKIVKLETGDYKEIAISGNKLLFPVALSFRKEKEVSAWYKRKGREIITKQVDHFAHEMKTTYKDITFSDTRSQWGRCTHDNRLQFSWRLVMAPLLVINYVVVHELAHTFEKNHTQMFWMKVRNYNPSYRQQIKWLKENGPSLIIQ